MKSAIFDARWTTLVGHFFRSFFRLNFLDDAGEESFRRGLIWLLTVIIGIGLFSARLFMVKYGGLSRSPSPDRYVMMLLADQLLMICLSTTAVALVVALILPSIFPDETDFRTLMTLPLSRRTIFSAKITALFLFSSIFVAISAGGFGGTFTLVSHGRWATRSLAVRLFAQMSASMAAGAFVVLTLVAVQGLIVVLAPRRWLQQVSVAVQTTLICGVMLTLPFVSRVPTLWSTLGSKPRWLFALPPAWFLGFQEWMLGSRDAYFEALAVTASVGFITAALVAAFCYAVTYSRFDQTVLRQAIDSRRLRWNGAFVSFRRHPGYDAIHRFAMVTLYRSGLHQLVFGGTFAVGLALAINGLLGNVTSGQQWSRSGIVEAPFTLMAGASVGLRLALLLPTNLRAAWIFRFAEHHATRRHQMDAVRWMLFQLGVALPAILAAPLYGYALGVRFAVVTLPVVLLMGWILTEMMSIEWRRIPFTCTFLFAKRPPAYTILVMLLIFGWFVFFGFAAVSGAASGWRPWLVVTSVLGTIAAALSRYRHLTWGRLPLEFEDYMPDEVHPLRLGP